MTENNSMQTAVSRTPPQSITSEQSILGALLLNNSALQSIVDIVREEDFYRRDHRHIFNVISTLIANNKPADHIIVAEELAKRGLENECGGRAYLMELANNTPSSANIRRYAEIVHEKAVLRQVVDFGDKAISYALAPEGREVVEIVGELERDVMGLSDRNPGARRGFQPLNKVLVDVTHNLISLYNDRNGTEVTGVKTYYPNLDQELAGLQRGDLIIIAGRPSMGKTTLAINIAENVALKSDLPVAVFSMEMGADQLVNRIISSQANINAQNLRRGRLTDEEWQNFSRVVSKMEQKPLYIDDTSNLRIHDLASRARRLVTQVGPLSLIIVDYIQLMSGSTSRANENRNMELSEISRGLKALAKELDCPVIALSQLSRAVDGRTNKRPLMSDLRESGAIEQDADVIMFIYRDWVYNKESDPSMAEVIVAKQRNGPVGTLRMVFRGGNSRFEAHADDKGYWEGAN